METQDTLGVESIRGLLERTPADPDVLRALIRRDPAFAAQCRQYRDVEVEIHRLRDRHARIERDLLARIEAAGQPGDGTGTAVTRPDIKATQAELRRMLADLIKAGLVSTNEDAVRRWQADAMNRHEELRLRLAALTDGEIHLDAVWNQARGDALGDPLVQAEENVKPVLSPRCPFTVPELAAADFSFVAAAARIRISAATG